MTSRPSLASESRPYLEELAADVLEHDLDAAAVGRAHDLGRRRPASW